MTKGCDVVFLRNCVIWKLASLLVPLVQALVCIAAPRPGGTVPIHLQLTAPPGLPNAGIPVVFSVVGADPFNIFQAHGVSDGDGIVRVDFPLTQFRSASAAQVIRAALAEESVPKSLAPAGVALVDFFQLRQLFAQNYPLVDITGPFVAGAKVVAAATLVESAKVTFQVTGSKLPSPRSMAVTDGAYPHFARRGASGWGVERLPRAVDVPLLFRDTFGNARFAVVDLSSGELDLGTLDFARPEGDSRLKIMFVNVPSVVSKPWVDVLHIPTAIVISLPLISTKGVATDGGKEPIAIDLPPGEVLLAVGAWNEGIWTWQNMRRLGEVVDPSLIPSISLVSGQTSEVTLDWTLSRTKFYNAIGMEPPPLPVPPPATPAGR